MRGGFAAVGLGDERGEESGEEVVNEERRRDGPVVEAVVQDDVPPVPAQPVRADVSVAHHAEGALEGRAGEGPRVVEGEEANEGREAGLGELQEANQSRSQPLVAASEWNGVS